MTLMEVQGRRRGIGPRLGVDVRAERYQNIHDIEILWIFWYDDVQGCESPIVDFTWIFRVFEEEGAERGNVAARDGVVDGRSHCDIRMLSNSFGYATKVIHM